MGNQECRWCDGTGAEGVRTVMVHLDLVLVVVGATIQDAMMNHVSNVTVEVQWM